MKTALSHLGLVRRFSSLYISGAGGTGKCSVVSPFVDFNKDAVPKKKADLVLRQTSANLDDISSLWGEYVRVKEQKEVLEEKRTAIGEKVNQLKRDGRKDEMEKLRATGKLLRDDLKHLMETFWGLEENVFQKILSLPNDLDPRTQSTEVVVQSFFDTNHQGVDHLQAGQHIVEYINPYTYFLKDEAALFEFAALNYFSQLFMQQGYIPFSNPDFARDVLLEGCGLQKNERSFPLASHGEHLNLVGGASLPSMCSYHAKSIHNEVLPAKYVGKGRQYYNGTTLPGLYGVWQKSAVQIFLGSEQESLMGHFESTQDTLSKAYESLELPFRVSYTAAQDLNAAESLRASFQLYSPFLGKYVEAGSLSLVGDFISRRLRMHYCHGDDLKFLHFLSGSVVKVPTLLAVLLEYGSNKKIPECISKTMGGIECLVK